MDIQKKIEEIRRKPEYIRLRWTWGLTAICALFVVIIWILSIRIQTGKTEEKSLTNDQKNLIDEFSQQKKSIQDAAGQLKNAYDETAKSGAADNENNTPEEGFNQ
jgi:hypothetical protein